MYLGFVLIRYGNICRYGNDYHEREDFTYSSLETGDSSYHIGPRGGSIRVDQVAGRAEESVDKSLSMGRNGRGRVSRFRIG